MTSVPQRLRDLTEHAVRAAEPAASLRAVTALREELVAFERLQVARMLDAGGSFGAVGQALGISRQAAHRRYRDLVGVELPDPRPASGAPRGRILVTSEARAAVNLAREEATALGAGTVGSEHLLLGIIRCDSARVASVLRTEVTLERARALRAADADRRPPPPAPPAPVAAGPQRHLRVRARGVRAVAARGGALRRRLHRRRAPPARVAPGRDGRRVQHARRARGRPRRRPRGARRELILATARPAATA